MRSAGRESVLMVIHRLAGLWMRLFPVEREGRPVVTPLEGVRNMLSVRNYRESKLFVKSNRFLTGKRK